MTIDPSLCLACQRPIPKKRLPLCMECRYARCGTIHPNWRNAEYWSQFLDAPDEPITNASEARYVLKEQMRNRFNPEGTILV